MVVGPDVSAETGTRKGRSNVILDDIALLGCGHVHGRISALAVERFVLYRDRVHCGTQGRVRLDILDEVIGEAAVIARVHVVAVSVAFNDAVLLHPA